MNEKYLLKYAIDYLSKYDSSKNNLINILKRKIYKFKICKEDKNKLLFHINNIIDRLEKDKLLDDGNFTYAKIRYLANNGKSKKYIKNYLFSKGINKYDIDENLNNFEESFSNWEIESALIFARKKKLLDSDEVIEKKLNKMSRAGFTYDICKKILN